MSSRSSWSRSKEPDERELIPTVTFFETQPGEWRDPRSSKSRSYLRRRTMDKFSNLLLKGGSAGDEFFDSAGQDGQLLALAFPANISANVPNGIFFRTNP
jgi:hypothetical protein